MPGKMRPVAELSKRQTLLSYLDRGVAMLHLDARRPGVSVPAQYAQDPHLRLNLSYRYGLPDLDIGEEQVSASLSFGGRSFHCVVPWKAIFGITSQATGDGKVWPEDLPVEVVEAVDEPQAARRPALAAVESADSAPPDEPSPPKARPHLRLVR